MIATVKEDLMFPSSSYFTLNSNPVFVITRKGKREVLVFDATMNIQSGNPVKNDLGVREVLVDVKSWSAKATSELLECDIEFRLTNLGENSRVTAKQLNQDFPGQLDFSMEYEVLINGEVAARGLSGAAQGEINSFPPKPNDIFYVSGKSVVLGTNRDTSIDVVACAC
jgi:hypothetical protein